MTRSPGSYRRHLGRELRHARDAAGYKQKQVAAVLRCEQGKIAKIETELVEIDIDELEKLFELYQLPEQKRQQLREARANSDIPRALMGLPKHPKAYQTMVDLESEAAEILCCHIGRIPGPCQSEQYMLKQFSWNRSDDRPDDRAYVTALVRERTARIGLFTVDPAPNYRVILCVSSLRRMPGGDNQGLALGQMQRLIELMKTYDQLDLRLLDWSADIPAVPTDFTVLRFRESTPDYIEATDFAYTEDSGGGHINHDIEPFLKDWAKLAKAALSREDTLAYLTDKARASRDQLVGPPTGDQRGSTP